MQKIVRYLLSGFALTILTFESGKAAECPVTDLVPNTTISGSLSADDCTIKDLLGGTDGSKVDQYRLTLPVSDSVTFTMQSDALDPFLYLYNNDLTERLADDDDSGTGLNATLTTTLSAGTYRVLANSSTQLSALGDYQLITVVPTLLSQTLVVSSILPVSRSVAINGKATTFATIINAGTSEGLGCGISLASGIAADFSYQTTDPATNRSVGEANTPVNIAPGAYQTYLISVTPVAELSPQEVSFSFKCTNSPAAGTTTGLNTLLLSASSVQPPDIVALAATVKDPGIINLPDVTGSGFDVFSVATVNVGSTGSVTVAADTGSTTLDLLLLLCQTDPVTAACINPTVPSSAPVTTEIAAGTTPTFAFFIAGREDVPFDPAGNRVFVRFRDTDGNVRGATSVAVRTAL
ncbi:MAG: hypothetical protein KDI36_18810 [Pseudomonadales bacterium]|nr:hypothetical protein [Pseudomonadales bacterium]